MNKLIGFPKRYENAPQCVGDGWWGHHKEALPVVDSGGILLLYGGHGTGKSRMAYELAKICTPPRCTFRRVGIESRHPCRYWTALSLFRAVKSTFHSSSDQSSQRIFDEAAEATLLVIDEYHQRGRTEWEDNELTGIIDARYAQEKPTILISNLGRQDFAAQLSTAVLDRIRENGLGLHFDWESFRSKPVSW
jgi:DNA replication protein DnaC